MLKFLIFLRVNGSKFFNENWHTRSHIYDDYMCIFYFAKIGWQVLFLEGEFFACFLWRAIFV